MQINLSQFKKIFDELARHQSYPTVFRDFLDACVCALAGGQMETEYLAIAARYTPSQMNLFARLFAEMVLLMDNDGTGYTDVLGEFFMQEITHGRNGQFFTPQAVTDMMAQMTGDGYIVNKSVCDPACGSGRTLMSFAQHSGKFNWFYGADVDETCAKMSLINFCLNGMRGEVAHMNTLSLELHSVWRVYYDPARQMVPTICKLKNEESVFYTRKDDLLEAGGRPGDRGGILIGVLRELCQACSWPPVLFSRNIFPAPVRSGLCFSNNRRKSKHPSGEQPQSSGSAIPIRSDYAGKPYDLSSTLPVAARTIA